MTRPSHPWIDDSRAPLYVFTYPSDPKVIAEKSAEYILAFRQLWQHIDRRVAIVADLSHVIEGPPAVRRALAEADKEMQPRQKTYAAAWGVVIRSNVQRLFFQAHLWMAPPVCPHELFEDSESAIAWARERLAAEGVHCADEPLALLRDAQKLAEGVRERALQRDAR